MKEKPSTDTVNNDSLASVQVLHMQNPELNKADRLLKLKSVSRYQHQEKKQRDPIEKLIEKYADCFHL